jgi:hypothetical protein
MSEIETDYKISLYPSKYHGYWRSNGRINIYVSKIWTDMNDAFSDKSDDEKIDEFTNDLRNVILIETLCFYRGKNKLKVKNKCLPHCKVARVANYLVFPDDWEGIREFYKVIDEEDKNEEERRICK